GGIDDSFQIAQKSLVGNLLDLTVGKTIAAGVVPNQGVISRQLAIEVSPNRAFEVEFEGHPIAGLDQRLPSTDPRKGNLDAVLRSAELNLLLKFYRGLRSIGNPSSHRGLQQFRFRKRLDLLRAEAENANRPGNVLDGLLAEISEGERQLIPDLIVSRAGDAQAAWLAQRLQPGSDIDAVAENVITIDDDVANVDADAEDDASILRYRGVAARHGTL